MQTPPYPLGFTASSLEANLERCVCRQNHVLPSREERRVDAEAGAGEGYTRCQGTRGLGQQRANQPESHGPRFGAACDVLIGRLHQPSLDGFAHMLDLDATYQCHAKRNASWK